MSAARLAPDDPRHGSLNGYTNLRCRCGPCTNALRLYYVTPGSPGREAVRRYRAKLIAAGLTAAGTPRQLPAQTDEEQAQEIVALNKTCKTTAEIANHLGVTRSAVDKRVAKLARRGLLTVTKRTNRAITLKKAVDA